jgi:3-O-acyltransferase
VSEPDTRPRALPALTGYRFYLALTVAVVHLTSTSQLFANDSLQLGLGAAVPLASAALASFFTLSGFVLTWSAPARDTARRFWRRRFFKIFPLHALGWAAAVVFFLVTTAPTPVQGMDSSLEPGPTLTSLFLLQGWIPQWDYLSYLNTPAWSISSEAFFYLLFPILLPFFQRIDAARLWRWCLWVAGGILLISVASLLISGPPQLDWLPFNLYQYWIVYTLPPVRLLNFVLGILLARIVQTGQWKRVARWKLVVATIVAFIVTPLLPFPFIFSAVLFVPLVLLIPNLALADLEGRGRVLRSRVLVALGAASYAFYIIHFPIMLVIRHLVGPDRRFDAGTGFLIASGTLVVAQLVALALHRWFEEPLRRRFARPRDESVVATDRAPGESVPRPA